MANNALVVVDMLNDFIAPDGALYVGDTVKKIIPEIQKKIASAREEGLMIIYLCDSHEQDDPEFKMFPPHSIKDTKGAEVYKDLRPGEDDIIVPKQRFSGFYNTVLESVLQEHKVDTLEICGVCTNICVLYTAADARNRLYNVVVDRRCVDSFDRAAHEFSLKEMARSIGVKIV